MTFIYNDFKFYKIVNQLIPDYITVCEPANTRFTASVHNSGYISKFSCSVKPNCDAFQHSFFYSQRRLYKNIVICENLDFRVLF